MRKAKKKSKSKSVTKNRRGRKPSGKPVRSTMNFKVSTLEAKQIRIAAKKYTRGNVTALIRLAVKAFRPKKSELVGVRKSTRS